MGLGKKFRTIGSIGNGLTGPLAFGRQLGGGEYGFGGQANLWLYRGALRIPGIYRATMLRCNLLSQTCWDAWTTHGQDQPIMLDPRPPLLEQPTPGDTRVTTLRSSMVDFLHDGNALFVIATRNTQGVPQSVWPVPAAFVGVRRITPANSGGTMLPVGAVEYQVGGQTFDSSDVIHVKGLCAPGALRGAGVLEAHLTGAIETAHEQQHQAQKMSRHGVPPGILKFSGDSPAANDPKKMRAAGQQWMDARDNGGVALMNSAVDFTPLAWKPDDMQMIEARQFSLLEQALIMGVPPKFVGASGGDPLNYSTSETEGRDLLRFTLSSDFEAFEQAFSLALPRGTTVKFDRTSFEQPDMLTRYQAYTTSIQAGWRQPSDVRREEHMPPVKGIDDVPTAAVQKKLNTELPADEPGLKQVTIPDTSQPVPVQATATKLPIPALPAAPKPGKG